MKNVPTKPWAFITCSAASWSALPSSKVRLTIVPGIAAPLADSPPPNPTSIPTDRANETASAKTLWRRPPEAIEIADVVDPDVVDAAVTALPAFSCRSRWRSKCEGTSCWIVNSNTWPNVVPVRRGRVSANPRQSSRGSYPHAVHSYKCLSTPNDGAVRRHSQTRSHPSSSPGSALEYRTTFVVNCGRMVREE